MATQRYISTSFWDDKWIMELDPSEKLLYLYLLTNPLTNIAGIYKITVKRISFDTGFTADTVGHIFEKFQKANKAHLVGEFIILPSWPKHQHWQTHDKIRAGILIELNKLPKEILKKAIGFQYAFEIPEEIYPQIASDSLTEASDYSDSDSNTDINTDTPSGVALPKYSKEFDIFWEVYPKKEDKYHAYEKYKATKKKGATGEMLLMAAKCYALYFKKPGSDIKYAMQAKRFLGPGQEWLEWYNNAEQIRRAEEKIPRSKYEIKTQPELTPTQIEANKKAVGEMMKSLNVKFGARRV